MPTYKDIAIQAARQAGDYTLGFMDKPVNYKMKNAHDIQAEADVGAEKIIIDTIESAFPDHDIFAEESGRKQKQSDYMWVIDPIDGTINFSRHIEEYCVSIALCHNDKVLVGVLYQPALKKLIVAEIGKGAYVNGRKAVVSKESKLINCLVATDNSSNIKARKNNISTLLGLSPLVRHTRIFGSTASCMGRIGEGQIDIFYKDHFSYWDYAAGILIVEEAGGKVTDIDGATITMSSRNIVATNGLMHDEALRLIKAQGEIS